MSEARGGGIGIAGVLGVVFIVLKLVGVIEWSWLWVLAPFWIPLGLVIIILIIGAIVIAISDAYDNRSRSKLGFRV